MATSLTLEVTTPRGRALQLEADSVQAPSVDGELGLLPNHLLVLAAVRCGLLKYRAAGKTHVAAVGPGFLEAGAEHVNVLSELFATPDAIDVADVRRELDEAIAALRGFSAEHDGPEYDELQRDIDWAQARIDAAAEASKL